jgi:hypothetical protein
MLSGVLYRHVHGIDSDRRNTHDFLSASLAFSTRFHPVLARGLSKPLELTDLPLLAHSDSAQAVRKAFHRVSSEQGCK